MYKQKRKRMKLSDIIIEKRHEKGLSREKLAFEANVSSSTIWNLEDDHLGIAWDNLVRICKVLEIDIYFKFNEVKEIVYE